MTFSNFIGQTDVQFQNELDFFDTTLHAEMSEKLISDYKKSNFKMINVYFSNIFSFVGQKIYCQQFGFNYKSANDLLLKFLDAKTNVLDRKFVSRSLRNSC